MASVAAKKGMRGIHVFWWIAGFFAVIIALDTLFVTWALQSFPGEQVKNSYVLGLDYNQEVARRREQEALGWTAEVGFSPASHDQLIVRLAGPDQKPLTGLKVAANLHILGTSKAATIELAEGSPGEYRAQIEAHAGARIETEISARRRSDEADVFKADKTLVMK